MHFAGGVVIRIEDEVVVVVEVTILLEMWLQHEPLEEPGDVREMPFGRTDIGHALHDEVLGLQVTAKFQRGRADARETRRQ